MFKKIIISICTIAMVCSIAVYADQVNSGNNAASANTLATAINSMKTLTEYPDDTPVDLINTVLFGSYPQSDVSGNVKEPIEWVLLDKKGGKALLLSKYILDNKCFNNELKNVTWENSDLRKWLNDKFLNEAFSESERKLIVETTAKSNDNVEYGTKGGNSTRDKVFCIGFDECINYFKYEGNHTEKKKLATKGTNYANKVDNAGSNLFVYGGSGWYCGNSIYWMRSTGVSYASAALIDGVGGVDNFGNSVDNHKTGVRPTIWITYN